MSKHTPGPWVVIVIDPYGVERLRTPMSDAQAKQFMAATGTPERRWCGGCNPSNCAGCAFVQKGGT